MFRTAYLHSELVAGAGCRIEGMMAGGLALF
jgi:hypothetical protein